ncbi:MAG: glycosyltransferase, partial [Alphaproteobacteria bacterium]|nr:glycosyltransferase [Alphaproteobacteria bacterium]
MKKIIINALSARLGGGQTYLRNLLANLPARQDIEIQVYAPASIPLPDDPRLKRRTTWWPTENPLLRTLWEIIALPGILKREKADILFCPGGIVMSRVPKGCRTVTMFRNMLPFDSTALSRLPFGLQKIRNFILKRIMLHSMTTADLTIFISEFSKSVV